MGIPVQRPAQGTSKSNLVRFGGESKSRLPLCAVLQGWKEIASELDRGVRTVQRWERTLGLPVHRLGKGSVSPVFAFEDELHLWLQSKADEGLSANITIPPPAMPHKSTSVDERTFEERKTSHRAGLKGRQTAKTPAIPSAPEIIKLLNAFFALEDARDKVRSCGHCQSPAQFLVGHFWLYGTEKTWQVSVPFCPNCDQDVRAMLPSPTSGPRRIT